MAIVKGNFTQPPELGQQTDGSNTFTYSHTHTGTTDGLLTVAVMCDGANSVSSVTYDGTAMTLCGSNHLTTTNSSKIYMYCLEGPSTGTNDVVVTMGGSFQLLRNYALSFTGAKAGRVDTISNDTSSPLSYDFTGTTANSWLYPVIQYTTTGGASTIDIDSQGLSKEWTLKFTWTGYAALDGPLSGGTHTIDSTWDLGGNTQAGIVFEIEEAGGTPPPTSRRGRFIVI